MTIGKLSQDVGVKVPTIRYYEHIGLLPAPPRTTGNIRLYDEKAHHRLTFIRHARSLGFEIPAIRQLLALADGAVSDSHQADGLAQAHLEEVQRKIKALKALRDELQHMIDHCDHDQNRRCHVIEVLSDHNKCQHDDHETVD